MLVLNLTVSVFYQQIVYAGPPLVEIQESTYADVVSPPEVICSDIWPDDPESQELLATQESIHDQLFGDTFKWCTGSFWELDEDIAEIPDQFTPVVTSGRTFGGEGFVIEVHDIVTIDLSEADLTEDEQQFVEEWSYSSRVYGTIVYGLDNEIEVWGLSNTLTDPDTNLTTTVFMPLSEGDVLPSGGSYVEGSNLNCEELTGIEQCLCWAKEDLATCLQRAKENFALIVGFDFLTIVLTVLTCLTTAILTGPLTPLVMAICIVTNIACIIAFAPALVAYLLARKHCQSTHARDVKRCNLLNPITLTPAPGL